MALLKLSLPLSYLQALHSSLEREDHPLFKDLFFKKECLNCSVCGTALKDPERKDRNIYVHHEYMITTFIIGSVVCSSMPDDVTFACASLSIHSS